MTDSLAGIKPVHTARSTVTECLPQKKGEGCSGPMNLFLVCGNLSLSQLSFSFCELYSTQNTSHSMHTITHLFPLIKVNLRNTLSLSLSLSSMFSRREFLC